MSFDIEYSEEKNELLKKTRGICFEDVIDALEHDGYITIIQNANKKQYKYQQILVININDYAYAVPFVWNEKKNIAFLKTVYPSRQLTKIYLEK